MKKIILISIILFSASFIFAQNQNYELKHSLGFSGGWLSGTGFSYRQMNEKDGFQITFGLIMLGDNDYEFEDTYEKWWWADTMKTYSEEYSGKETSGNIGFTYYKPLHKGNRTSFYLLAGISSYLNYGSEFKQDYIYDPIDSLWCVYGEVIESKEFDYTINTGFGIGMEWQILKNNENFILSFEWPLVFSFKEDDFSIMMYIPQAGIHYYFK